MRSMASSGSCRGIAAVIGVGPKLGLSIARKFAHEGYTVAILARDLGICYSVHLIIVLFFLKKRREFNDQFGSFWIFFVLQGDCRDLLTR